MVKKLPKLTKQSFNVSNNISRSSTTLSGNRANFDFMMSTLNSIRTGIKDLDI